MTENNSPGLWVGQTLHIVSLLLLLTIVAIVWFYLGQPAVVFFWLTIGIPVCHQVYVWLTWRFELASMSVSKSIGFQGYLIGFFALFAGRFITLAALAWVDRGSLELGIVTVSILGTALALPGFYAMYSVHRYFGMKRAAGADHFEVLYREMALVKEGIFRFTDNGMYLYAFGLFWAIAIAFDSAGALLVAVFSHIYIWVHYYATEKPDMDYLYR